ncbi:aldose 1-epimerase family protein [Herbidospora cretacea]|uniref:aldose 1-epimerase family protein n=1 Tax=Herbidospora cretacea TaxID=28444 RepID=UPI000773B5B1|nr:aldose 1-epimerase family protein [Herbidospora cretacea]
MPQYTLLGGGYRAELTELGGAVSALTHGGRDLIPSRPVDGPIEFYNGTVLAPWPNRVVGARYVFADECFELPVNEPDRGHALHGFVSDAHWSCVEFTAIEDHRSSAVMTYTLEPHQGYPYRLALTTTYVLDESGLKTTLKAENIGDAPAPYGCGPHPWLLAGPDVTEYTLSLPAGKVFLTDELLAPTDLVPVDGTEFDFRVPHPLGTVSIDHAYTGLTEGRVVVSGPGGGVAVTWDHEALPWVQVCNGVGLGYQGVAVEPMTCPPDAFNSGTDLIVLKPGDTHEASWTLSAA